MVERNNYRMHIPFCETRVPLVDQFVWPEKDTSERICQNGESHQIYNCRGEISYTLPLYMYPRVGTVHPQIRGSDQPHFMERDPFARAKLTLDQLDLAEKRISGFYTQGM